MDHGPGHLQQSILTVARTDAAVLEEGASVAAALEAIRREAPPLGGKIVYFYVVDARRRLVGVLPTRRLLTAPPTALVRDIMVTRVLSLPSTATVLDGCEAFVLHKLLALPVVDSERRILGVVDVGLLSDEAFELAGQEETDAIFESIGLRLAQVRDASPWRAFRFRFPWLLATIASGTVCAVLAGMFELTLADSLILAFFLTLVLGLGESVAMQSMALAIQALRGLTPSRGWYLRRAVREGFTAVLLGAACGSLVGLIAWAWRGTALEGVVIGASILVAMGVACLLGLTVPTVLHALKLDPKVAAGPVTLAVTDVCTLSSYFGMAALVL